jgi:Uma2 family endonuclease
LSKFDESRNSHRIVANSADKFSRCLCRISGSLRNANCGALRLGLRGYNSLMEIQTAGYLDAIEHLPEGTTLIIQQFSWDDYETLLQLLDRPNLRTAYDCGRLEIVSPLPEHEEYSVFIDALVRILSEELKVKVQSYGSATWKRRSLAKGVEPDACYYVANASRVSGKRKFDLEVDPPPDIVVEIDITNESLSKFPIYAALSVPEIWHYSGGIMRFFKLTGDIYNEVSKSRFFAGLRPTMLADALEQSKTTDQTTALQAFRQRLQSNS